MSRIKFELNLDGLRELMKSSEMQEVLGEAGEVVIANGQSLSGEPYGKKIVTAKYVSICQVFPVGYAGYKDSIDNNTALKALSSSGLPMSK